ncbi:MAG: murein biosynthesis integral membrane protein MurJ [Oscillospiraceae bacterium]|nr:murein biosynthesis integral membrane protein MurJ [Oscillospiraceae bacterium]
MPSENQPIVKSALIITIITAISGILGFLRESVIAAVFGVGAVTDAYVISIRVVMISSLLVSVYLSKTFISTYLRTREEQGDDAALAVANNALGVSLVVNIGLMILVQIFAPQILQLTGFDSEQVSASRIAIRIAALQLPILAFVHFFFGYLSARKSFFGPNFMGIPMNIIMIAVCLIAGTQSGIVGLSIAGLLGMVAQCLIFLIWLPKEKYRYKRSVRFNTPEIRSDVKILMPALVGSALLELNAWVDMIIATFLGEGIAAAINFATRLPNFVQGLLVLPIASMVYSYMSEYAAKNDTEKMLNLLWKTVRTILFLVVPIIVIAIPSSFDIVRIVFERGAFTPEATLLTGTALMWYLPSLLGLTIYNFLIRFFYSLQDTKTPMFCSAVTISITIALSLWLSRFMGIGGIALATSIGSGLSSVLLLILLRRKMGPLGFFETAMDVLKMGTSAAPCAFAVLGIRHLMIGEAAILRFGISTLVGGIVYLLTAFVLKEMVLLEGIQLLKGRFAKNKAD